MRVEAAVARDGSGYHLLLLLHLLLHFCISALCFAALLDCTAIQVDVTPGLLVNMPSQCNLLPLHRHRPERYIAS